jgi:hypothetical protein
VSVCRRTARTNRSAIVCTVTTILAGSVVGAISPNSTVAKTVTVK